MNQLKEAIKGFVFVGQLGISLVTPPLCMVLLAGFLMKKFKIGIWIMILFLIFGLLVAVSTAKSFYRSSQKKIQDSADEEKPIGFNKRI